MREFNLDEAVYTYLISGKAEEGFTHQFHLGSHGLVINYTARTDLLFASDSDRCLAVIGLCIDALGKAARDEIPRQLLACSRHRSVTGLFQACDRLAGKYIILYGSGDRLYIWGDATCSIPINYGYGHAQGSFAASPFDRMTASRIGAAPDSYLKKIRDSQDASQAMPGDLTPYQNVHALLPEQYLEIHSGHVTRTPLALYDRNRSAYPKRIAKSLKLARGIARELAEYENLVCPLTSGYDSRMVFAAVREVLPDIRCFTQKYKGFDEMTADLHIPRIICKNFGIPYRELAFAETPKAYISQVMSLAGYANSSATIREAFLYTQVYPNQARLNGNIAGQIGKSSVTNTVPECFATPAFFRCKIHNTSAEAKQEIRKYLDTLRESGPSVCDRFVLESRCGRWAGQEEALYSLCGMKSLNLFNCRRILRYWMSIDRGYRSRRQLHEEWIRMCDRKLLQFPFNPGEPTSLLKSNWVFYYLATFAKQLLLEQGIHRD